MAAASTWLKPTPWININHPSIQSQAHLLTSPHSTSKSKALAIFRFVRDDIKFGFSPSFYNINASDVLAQKIGFCTPKTTLFVALCRASGIPSRMRFASLRADVLYGFGIPLEKLDHGYAEVMLDGKWVQVDSYTVDSELAEKARERLRSEGRKCGYGIDLEGTTEWDGERDAYVQKTAGNLIEDWGDFEDVEGFYGSNKVTQNHKYSWPFTLALRFLLSGPNNRIVEVRDEKI
ncbi:hypothetical protein BJ742DRAFT_892709 [Cladochytrium replicatum]|nr:hypothetical protein BJ742DRAFT_892709 [Cladochytrium replicatum]